MVCVAVLALHINIQFIPRREQLPYVRPTVGVCCDGILLELQEAMKAPSGQSAEFCCQPDGAHSNA